MRTIEEVKGSINVKETKKPKERSSDEIKRYHKENRKMFKVYYGNDTEEWEKVNKFWLKFKDKKISNKSMLDKDNEGFYKCSTTSHLKKYELFDLKKH